MVIKRRFEKNIFFCVYTKLTTPPETHDSPLSFHVVISWLNFASKHGSSVFFGVGEVNYITFQDFHSGGIQPVKG